MILDLSLKGFAALLWRAGPQGIGLNSFLVHYHNAAGASQYTPKQSEQEIWDNPGLHI